MIKNTIVFLVTIILPCSVKAFYNNQSAEIVLGQSNFLDSLSNQGGSQASTDTFNHSYGIYCDGTKLFIADTDNHRVLIYNQIPADSNTPADVVVGQTNFYSQDANQNGSVGANTLKQPMNVYSDGTRLFIADYGNHRVLIYNTIPNTNNASADIVVGQVTLSSGSINQGAGLYNCQANTLSYPWGVLVVGSKLIIADSQNSRVLVYNAIPAVDNASADVAIGQVTLSSGSFNRGEASPTAKSLKLPYCISSDGTKLFVADQSNSRVLIYNTIPAAQDADFSADVVIGQTGFSNSAPNQGGNANVNTLRYPMGVYWDNSRLYITDAGNNRVLIFNSIPSENNTSADVVIGQSDFISSSANQGVDPSTNTLSAPAQVARWTGKMAVIERDNNRALVFPDIFGIYTISPDNAQNTGTVNVTITGDDFLTGSSVKLAKTGQGDITATNVSVTTKTITCTFDISGQSSGRWGVIVTSDSVSAALSEGFEVKSFAITEIIPNFAYNRGIASIYIKGSNFLDGSTAKLTRSGESDIDAEEVDVSSSLVICSFNLRNKKVGLWNVVISSGDVSDTFTDSFLIASRVPSGVTTEVESSGLIDSSGGTIVVDLSGSILNGTKIIIPAGAVSANISINISISAVINPPAMPDGFTSFGRIIHFGPSGLEFNDDVTLQIPYSETDLGNLGINNESLLCVYNYDTENSIWQKIDAEDITVDSDNYTVDVKRRHFSLYVLGASVVTNFSNTKVYPNPFRFDRGHTVVTFSNIISGSKIEIYTISGEFVCEINDTDNDGQIEWDIRNSSGKRVASGVYMCLISHGSSKVTKKVAVVK
ncbi:MAG: T9SS type A sorting domain-containing protein [Elusimicrobia bacterium]|nr:T9SS type A sorting domain-containing protein [Elusimicrobiota bacterium]